MPAQAPFTGPSTSDITANTTFRSGSFVIGQHCGFRANAVYLMLSAIAYNLLCLMRLLLPAAWYGKRAITFRHRLYAMAGQVVHHAQQRILKVRPDDLALLDETLWTLRNCRLS